MRKMPDWTWLRASVPSAYFTATDVANTMIATGTTMKAIVRNWRLQVGEGALLDRLGDLPHLRRAGVRGQHAPREGEAHDQGQHGGERRADEDEPLTTVQREVLVAAFGSEH